MKVLLLVGDSFGVGATPDAASFGDEGTDTIGHVAAAVGGIDLPNLGRLGLGHLTDVQGVPSGAGPGTAHGKMRERSAGKDSTTGHWEIAGIVTERPFPTYPEGFPPEVIAPFEERIGATVLGNRPASGTVIIEELGEEHLATGRPIVYTSADSVFQIATHKDVVPLERLYGWCRTAREVLTGEHAVGRVIARPFVGEVGSFTRTHERRDFSVPPPRPTFLERIAENGVPVYGVGKIADIFVGRGIAESAHSESDDDGVDRTLAFLRRGGHLLVMTNLVDFDTKFGHRNDPQGYAGALGRLDRRVPELLDAVGDGLLFVTGDHGCETTDESTDHTREHVPVLAGGGALGHREPVDLGTRDTFADLGATVAELFGVFDDSLAGTSFRQELLG